MNTVTFNTEKTTASGWVHLLSLGLLAAGAWALSTGTAQARGQDDVYWSIGVQSPGVSVGVSNAPPPRQVVVQPQPVVIYQPAPVVVHRPHMYPHQPYPYVRPVVVQPQPVVVHPGWGYGPRWDDRHDRRHWKQRQHRHDRWDRDDRDDDRRGGGHR